MLSPSLSILLPVYNGARYLDAQIDSVVAQSFADFELLIQDDGSSDGTADIARSWAARDPRIIFRAGERNVGQRATLQQLVSRARARRIAFCDQDDVWETTKLERLVPQVPVDGLAYGASHLIDAVGGERGATLFDYVGAPVEGHGALDLLTGNTVSAHAMVTDRSCITPAAFKTGSVFDWTIAVTAAANGGIKFDPQAITFHRQHGGNFCNRLDEPKQRFASDGAERLMQWARLFEALAAHPAAAPDDAKCWARFRDVCAGWRFATSRACFKNIAVVAAGTEAIGRLDGGDAARRKVEKTLEKLSRGDWHPRVVLRRLRLRASNSNDAAVSNAA